MGILALIQAIIQLPSEVRKLAEMIAGLRAEWADFQKAKWIQKLNDDFAPIEKPSTSEEKQNAAKAIGDDIARL